MNARMADFTFELMANVGLPIRNIFLPPQRLLQKVEIRPGARVLDFGCGPGAFTFLLAERAGKDGVVYALDIHPLALRKIERTARAGKYANVRTILSDCATGLPDGELDRIILFDVFHLLANPQAALAELHRVLKPEGILYFSDHHMKDEEILVRVTQSGLFRLRKRGEMVSSFSKV
jgi:ubiquinone/menaquinone biosynthesis C-methylase UbiE